jgi:hypothetical protein
VSATEAVRAEHLAQDRPSRPRPVEGVVGARPPHGAARLHAGDASWKGRLVVAGGVLAVFPETIALTLVGGCGLLRRLLVLDETRLREEMRE